MMCWARSITELCAPQRANRNGKERESQEQANLKIFRFDQQVSIPISEHGSDFTIGALIGPDSRVQVQVMHLPRGGLIGRHETAAQQLFAAVAGSGWVCGADGLRRDLKTGFAALWEAGEEHQAGSETGLTAICIEGEFEMWAMSVSRDIVVAEYDSAWPDWFERIRARVWPAIEEIAIRIDHVGSTAVPGLAAKPIIDMDVVVSSEDKIRPVVDRLAGIGYRWRGNMGVVGREAFTAPSETGLPAHNLYLVVENNKAHMDHWLLRDLMRADPGARERYAVLKRRNVELAGGDIDAYVSAKAAFVADLLRNVRAERGLPAETYWDPRSA